MVPPSPYYAELPACLLLPAGCWPLAAALDLITGRVHLRVCESLLCPLTHPAVRAFSDTDTARVRNHVLFASHANLVTANLTAAVEAVQAASAVRYSSSGGTEEMLDPLQLRVWSGLPGREVQLMYDRQRCQQMLTWHDGLPAGRSTVGDSQGSGGSGGSRVQLKGQPPLLWRKLREMRERHALATAHWVVARIQFADSLWLS
jgi:hypothetical protein